MKKMHTEKPSIAEIKNPAVANAFNAYPQHILQKMLFIRQLILETTAETEGINEVEETLKWGEPSYLVKNGSTIRMAWKESKPDQYALYFNCQTTLVDTFKKLYGSKLTFEGNRAIVFAENNELPVAELKYCILLALTYHSRKHLPILGV